jgi:thiol-disulfide isomerase/thioredoxin
MAMPPATLRPVKKLVAFLFVCLTVAAAAARAATPGEVAIGSTLREASLSGLSDPDRKLSDYRGKPLVINVWASWCGPCRQEMGSLDRLARRFGPQQMAVIGISTDDYPENARAFLRVAGTSFSHFIDHDLVLENMLGANRLPLTVLVDAKGRVLDKIYGATVWDSPEMIEAIRQIFHLRTAY